MCLPNGFWTSFKESIKALEADIQHANTLSLEYPRENDCACYQMRLQYDSLAKLFFLVPGADCSFAGALGLLRILIYKVYTNGTTSKMTFERKASLREFYGFIYPYLLQLGDGFMNMKFLKQGMVVGNRSKNTKGDKRSEMDGEDSDCDQECDICMEKNEKMVLPDCTHGLCIKCYKDWNERSQSCPFCRDSLKKVNSVDLWVIINADDVKDMTTLGRQDVLRLFRYIDKLPVAAPEKVLATIGTYVDDSGVHFTTDPFGCGFYDAQVDEYQLRITTNPYGCRFSYTYF
ncbi:hypothetical protein O6H91_01G157200 [Diphasiastrum complanatum]|uniref:Uncharacterized protein n=1 Tax=Diphasiastrum complanatum TaxID=34168 RepID=A0ACC2EY21_DIPCM|nr:hypothetical protein O6H91_01G157200 [Diphasiastrum complanatum]